MQHSTFLLTCRALTVLGFTLLLCMVAPEDLRAQEVIKNFESDLWVHADASLTVKESITVISEGREIKRGIYRDFPTDYKDKAGNQYRVGFSVEKVTRNGQPEPFHTEQLSNGVRLYIGSKDKYIDKGEQRYAITYNTSRQIGFFDELDELYWNVTGNGWAFAIENASARVHLPDDAPVLNFSAYTGYEGETGRAFGTRDYVDGIGFYTTQPLRAKEGLTIAVSWPIGYVDRPTESEKLGYLFTDNRILIIGLAGLLVLVAYYSILWLRVGRDPAAGTIIPLFEPPDGYSPAAMRYIRKMGFDDKVFTAAIVNMAVKGFLTISDDSSGKYRLAKTGENVPLSVGERAVARGLFSGFRDEIELKKTNHRHFRKARDGLKEWLRTEFEKNYFNTNRMYFFSGAGLSFIVIILMIAWAQEPIPTAFISLWLSGWTVGVYFLLRKGLRAWRSMIGGDAASGVNAILTTIIAIPFIGGEFAGLFFFVELASPAAAVIFLLIQIVNVVFYHLLKAPTLLGRKMLDRFAGFGDFLGVTEKDRMNFFNPPDRTPELFEHYLPFAIALDVENAWSEQFADAFSEAGEGPWQSQGYRPSWYHGRHFNASNISGFSSTLGSGFTNAISSASTAPGSSSGSSGGGSSGGGGGGDGGGGW